MASSSNAELGKQRLQCYRGIARVSLESLTFRHALAEDKHRAISQENVRRLERVFEHNGCLRLQEEHVINATVHDDDLAAALAKSHITETDFRRLRWTQDAPSLDLPSIRCLSGLHRIEAARQFLDENDKWWVVRLFSYDTPKETLTQIIESYAHEQRPCDGEIFRKIRLYHRDNDDDSENRWWACLQKSKLKDLRQLLKRRCLVSAFDGLIDMPGLWMKVQIGALHRLLALKCDEEMVLYLEYIAKSWKYLLHDGTQTLSLSMIDSDTVQYLELLAPSSPIDKGLIQDLMDRGVLFPSQSSPRIRKVLLDNIYAFPGVIPSLRTFFDTLKYLEPTCEALKKLLDKRLKTTIRSSLQGLFWAPAQSYVRISESQHAEVQSPINKEAQFLMAYADLWAFCSRHFDGLTAATPLKEPNEPKPVTKGPNPVTWHRLAQYSLSQGFIIPNAQMIASTGEECYTQLALDYLGKAHPSCSTFSKAQIEDVKRSAQLVHSSDSSGTDLDSEHLPQDRRSGRPFEVDFLMEKQVLFIPTLFNIQVTGDVTLTFVRRELFSCLFGRHNLEARFGSPISDRSVMSEAAEDMDIDTPHVQDQYLKELETLKSAKCELERRYSILVDQNRVLREEAQQRIQQGLYTDEQKKGFERNQQEVNRKLQEELHTARSQNAELEYSRVLCEKAKQNLMKDLHTAQVQHNELGKIHFLCKEAKEKLQKELHSKQTQYTDLENKYCSLSDLLKIYSDERELLRKDRDDLGQKLAGLPRTSVDQSPRLEPLPIDPDSVSIFEDLSSDDETTLFDAQHVHRWAVYTGEHDIYELFIGLDNDSDGCIIGRSFSVTSTEVASIIETAKEHFSGIQLSAFTVLGKRLPNLEPLYIFNVFSPSQRTIFLAPENVASKYIASTVVSLVPRPDGIFSSVLTIANTAIVPWQRRKRRPSDDNIVFTKESTTEHEVKVFKAGEDRGGNKRRLLQLKKRIIPE